MRCCSASRRDTPPSSARATLDAGGPGAAAGPVGAAAGAAAGAAGAAAGGGEEGLAEAPVGIGG